MSWFARIFANALARRLAVVIVAGVLAWFGIGQARAQSFEKCYSDQQMGISAGDIRCPDRGTAFAQAERLAIKLHTEPSVQRPPCTYAQNATVGWYYCLAYPNKVFPYEIGRGFLLANQCPDGQEWNDVRGSCQKPCSSQSQRTVNYQSIVPSGSYACVDGCTARVTPTGDGTYTQSFLGGTESHCLAMPKDCSAFGAGYTMNYGTSMCQAPAVECAENEVKDPISGTCTQGCSPGLIMDANGLCKAKEDQCPPGNVKSPTGSCLPGEGQCAVGEVKGKDGTCKRDADGDGKPDAGEDEGTTDETFSGGDSCDSPPACSGSPIMCGQARIQWRIDCNTRKNTSVTGGSCAAVPLCIGKNCDAVEYAQLLQQWNTRCAMEKLLAKDFGEGEKGIKDHMTALKQAEVNGLRALGQDDGHSGITESDIWAKDSDYGDGKLDSGLFGGGGGTCSYSFTIGGQTISPPPQFWRMVSLIHWLLIAGAYLWVASKLG